MMFLIECYFASSGVFQKRKDSSYKALMQGHLKSNQLSLLTIIVISVQNSKLHHHVLVLLYPAHLTVPFAENAKSKLRHQLRCRNGLVATHGKWN